MPILDVLDRAFLIYPDRSGCASMHVVDPFNTLLSQYPSIALNSVTHIANSYLMKLMLATFKSTVCCGYGTRWGFSSTAKYTDDCPATPQLHSYRRFLYRSRDNQPGCNMDYMCSYTYMLFSNQEFERTVFIYCGYHCPIFNDVHHVGPRGDDLRSCGHRKAHLLSNFIYHAQLCSVHSFCHDGELTITPSISAKCTLLITCRVSHRRSC